MRTPTTAARIAAAAQTEVNRAIHCLEVAADYIELVHRVCSEQGWPLPDLPVLPELPATTTAPPPAHRHLGQNTRPEVTGGHPVVDL